MQYIETFKSLVDGFKLVSMFGLFALDTILGIVLAIANGKFAWSRVADFVETKCVFLGLGYFAVGIFATLEPTYAASVPVVWALINAKMVADVLSKIKELLQKFGINFPGVTA